MRRAEKNMLQVVEMNVIVIEQVEYGEFCVAL